MVNDSEVLLEFRRQGNFMRVTAVDPVTGIEAVIVGSPSMPEAYLSQSAVRKLRYLIEKSKKT